MRRKELELAIHTSMCKRINRYVYISEENDGLISCGGGELMCEILPYLDFESIKMQKPKWYLGYSDNTNFTFLHTILNDVATIYGSNVGAFGIQPWHKSVQDLYQVLYGVGIETNDCIKTFQVEGYERWEKNPYVQKKIP